MGLYKPTADAHRLQTGFDNVFGPDAIFVCCWMKFDTLVPNYTMYYGINSNVRGSWLRLASTAGGVDISLAYVNSAASNDFTTHAAHGIAANEWAWWFGGVDSSGNSVCGVNTNFSTGGSTAPRTTGDVVAPTIMNRFDGGANNTIGTIADFRFYNRLLSTKERDIVYAAEGKDGIIDGLVSCMSFLDAEPAVDTDTTLPVDVASPARSWTTTGTGDPYTYQGTPYPNKRRRR